MDYRGTPVFTELIESLRILAGCVSFLQYLAEERMPYGVLVQLQGYGHHLQGVHVVN